MEDHTATFCKEEVLFNSDTLPKIISYLPSIDLLSLALTCKRFGVSSGRNPSLAEDCARIAIQDLATEEQLATLPYYDRENSLANYHYLQLLRGPLTFDQLVGTVYVNIGDKSCVVRSGQADWGTAISNNILRAGKHYVSFKACTGSRDFALGVMRPGQANQHANGSPLWKGFYQHFSWNKGRDDRNSIHCCVAYDAYNGYCHSSDWEIPYVYKQSISWEGRESRSPGDEIGMLLDLDEGTLSVFKNDRKLGVMKRGLVGPYCWVATMRRGTRVTIKRGTIPPC